MSEVWGTIFQLERDKATGNDPASLRAEIGRLRAALELIENRCNNQPGNPLAVKVWDDARAALHK